MPKRLLCEWKRVITLYSLRLLFITPFYKIIFISSILLFTRKSTIRTVYISLVQYFKQIRVLLIVRTKYKIRDANINFQIKGSSSLYIKCPFKNKKVYILNANLNGGHSYKNKIISKDDDKIGHK